MGVELPQRIAAELWRGTPARPRAAPSPPHHRGGRDRTDVGALERRLRRRLPPRGRRCATACGAWRSASSPLATTSRSPLVIPPSSPPPGCSRARFPRAAWRGARQRTSSWTREPSRAAASKPSPISTPFTAGIDMTACAIRPSSRSSHCAQLLSPGGRPGRHHDEGPPERVARPAPPPGSPRPCASRPPRRGRRPRFEHAHERARKADSRVEARRHVADRLGLKARTPRRRSAQELAHHGRRGDARARLARARALEHRPSVVGQPLVGAREVGVARARPVERRLGRERGVAVGDAQQQRRACRLAAHDAGGDLDAVASSQHAAAAPESRLAARELRVDRGRRRSRARPGFPRAGRRRRDRATRPRSRTSSRSRHLASRCPRSPCRGPDRRRGRAGSKMSSGLRTIKTTVPTARSARSARARGRPRSRTMRSAGSQRSRSARTRSRPVRSGSRKSEMQSARSVVLLREREPVGDRVADRHAVAVASEDVGQQARDDRLVLDHQEVRGESRLRRRRCRQTARFQAHGARVLAPHVSPTIAEPPSPSPLKPSGSCTSVEVRLEREIAVEHRDSAAFSVDFADDDVLAVLGEEDGVALFPAREISGAPREEAALRREVGQEALDRLEAAAAARPAACRARREAAARAARVRLERPRDLAPPSRARAASPSPRAPATRRSSSARISSALRRSSSAPSRWSSAACLRARDACSVARPTSEPRPRAAALRPSR